MTAVTAGLPPGLLTGDAVVGRGAEVCEFRRAVADALAGHGRLFLLGGAAGIGKTTLAADVAAEAQEAGAAVRWGSCREGGGGRPLEPWAHVLGDDFPRLLPDASQLGARGALFHTLTQTLVELAAPAGLVVVLDDLHAADAATLKVLGYLARFMGRARLLILGTYRDPDARSSPALQQTLAGLARDGRKVALAGLYEEEMTELLERTTEAPVPAAIARRVHQATDGSPFLVHQIGRLLRDGGDLVLDDDASGLVRRRLEPAGPGVREALLAASVLGQEFEAGVVSTVLDQEADGLLAEAERFDAVVDAGHGRFRFWHALVREALYEELRPSQRVALHRRAGDALARISGAPAFALAHHFTAAARDGNGTEAAVWCAEAGDEAGAALAFEDAAALYGRALEALALGPPAVDEGRRYELFLALAGAHQRAGEAAAAHRAYEGARRAARVLGSPARLAEAAVADAGSTTVVVDEALAALPAGDTALRARLLARHRAGDLRRQGVAMARRLADADVLRAALWDCHRAHHPAQGAARAHHPAQGAARALAAEFLDERLAVSAELVELAEDGPARVLAHRARALDLLLAGDLVGAAAEVQHATRDAEALRQPYLDWAVAVAGAGVALAEGRLDDAELHARQALAAGDRAEAPAARAAFADQLGQIHRHRRQWDDLAGLLRGRPDRPAGCLRIGLGVVAAHRGDRDEAERAFADHPAHLDCCPLDLAELAWSLDATAGAGPLYDRLLPLGGRHVVAGEGHVSLGAGDRYLGMLAALAGRFDDADAHFQAAHRLHARMRSPLWDAYAFADHARMLRRRGGPGDREAASDLAGAAGRALASLGLAAGDGATPAPAPAPVTVERARLSQEGEYRVFEYGGRVARLRDSKGLRYLAQLLARPGAEHHALDLVGGRRAGASDAGPVLDAEAKSAYRARVAELSAERDEAAADHDLGRAERAQAELDFLLAELAGAVGLGGRDRRAASDAERARQSVTRAVKGAVERLAEAHPDLGEHLRSTVRTGTYSTYAPDPAAPITWEQ